MPATVSLKESRLYQRVAASLASTLTGCCARIITSTPNDADKQKVLALNEILIIRSNRTYQIGFCNSQGAYEQRDVALGRRLEFCASYKEGTFIENQGHIATINEILDTVLHSTALLKKSSLDDDSLKVLEPRSNWQSIFHKNIVNKILKPNEYLMKLWGFFSIFHNLSPSNHIKFKKLNQALNCAIKALYETNALGDCSPMIRCAIDGLLLDHLDKMRKSELFNSNLDGICADHRRDLPSQIILTRVNDDEYELSVNSSCCDVFSAANSSCEDRTAVEEAKTIVKDYKEQIKKMKEAIGESRQNRSSRPTHPQQDRAPEPEQTENRESSGSSAKFFG